MLSGRSSPASLRPKGAHLGRGDLKGETTSWPPVSRTGLAVVFLSSDEDFCTIVAGVGLGRKRVKAQALTSTMAPHGRSPRHRAACLV